MNEHCSICGVKSPEVFDRCDGCSDNFCERCLPGDLCEKCKKLEAGDE